MSLTTSPAVRKTFTFPLILARLKASGLVKIEEKEEEALARLVMCNCHRCVSEGARPINGHRFCLTTDRGKLFFYKDGCSIEEGYKVLEKEPSAAELAELFLATFDEKFVQRPQGKPKQLTREPNGIRPAARVKRPSPRRPALR